MHSIFSGDEIFSPTTEKNRLDNWRALHGNIEEMVVLLVYTVAAMPKQAKDTI
jgi:hypothetical protein